MYVFSAKTWSEQLLLGLMPASPRLFFLDFFGLSCYRSFLKTYTPGWAVQWVDNCSGYYLEELKKLEKPWMNCMELNGDYVEKEKLLWSKSLSHAY